MMINHMFLLSLICFIVIIYMFIVFINFFDASHQPMTMLSGMSVHGAHPCVHTYCIVVLHERHKHTVAYHRPN